MSRAGTNAAPDFAGRLGESTPSTRARRETIETEPTHSRWPVALACFFAALALITVARWPVIDSPPYYDFAFSFWPEAWYLARTDFDFQALRYDEAFLLSEQGGPRAYMTSLLPAVAAVGMRLFADPRGGLIWYHVFTFGCAAIVATVLFLEARRWLGVIPGALVALVVLTTPVFSAQVDMLGMEIPLAAATSVTALCVARGRYSLAALASFAAFFMKATGLIVSLALASFLFAALSVELMARRTGRPWLPIAIAWVLACMAVAAEWEIAQWGDAFTGQLMDGPPLAMLFVWSPDLVVIGALVAVLGIGAIGYWLVFGPPADMPGGMVRRGAARIASAIERRPIVPFGAILLAGIVAAIYRGPFLPRYLAFGVPILYLLAVELLALLPRALAGAGLVLVLGVNLVNWNGALFPDVVDGMNRFWGVPGAALARSGSFYERSHEYLADHQWTERMIKRISGDHGGEPIVTSLPFNYFLAYPQFGYVDRPAVVYSTSPVKGVDPSFRDFTDLARDRPRAPIFIKAPSYFTVGSYKFEIPRAGPDDEILFPDESPWPIEVYRKEWPTPPSDAELEAWYQARVWRESQVMGWLAQGLIASGPAECVERLRKASSAPDLPEQARHDLEALLAGMLFSQGKVDEARKIQAAWGSRPDPATPPADTTFYPSSRFARDLRLARNSSQPDLEAMLVSVKHLRLTDAARYARALLNSDAIKAFPAP